MDAGGAAAVTDLDHRALLDKEAGDLDRIGQGAAAVVAQVDDQPVNLLLVELFQLGPHVIGRVAALPLAGPGEVAVEARYFDIAEFLIVFFENGPLDEGLLDLDDIADDRNDGNAGIRFLDRQADLGPFLAADQADGVAQAHIDDIDRLVRTLSHLEDLVFRFQLSLAGGGAAGDDLDHLDVAVLFAQGGADPFERAAHADIEILLRLGRQVDGVRVKGPGDRVEVRVEVVLLGVLHQAGEKVLVAFQDFFPRHLLAFGQCARFDPVLLVVGVRLLFLLQLEIAVQDLVLEPLAPAFAQVLFGGGKIDLFRIGFVGLVDGKVEVPAEDVFHQAAGLFEAVPDDFGRDQRQADAARLQLIVNPVPVRFEDDDVRLQQKTLLAVEGFQVEAESGLGERIIDAFVAVVIARQAFLEHVAEELGPARVVVEGRGRGKNRTEDKQRGDGDDDEADYFQAMRHKSSIHFAGLVIQSSIIA